MTRKLKNPNHRLTATGYYVAAFARHSDHYSGRVVEDSDGNWLDVGVYANWDKQGAAINHEFGNLVRRKNNDDRHD